MFGRIKTVIRKATQWIERIPKTRLETLGIVIKTCSIPVYFIFYRKHYAHYRCYHATTEHMLSTLKWVKSWDCLRLVFNDKQLIYFSFISFLWKILMNYFYISYLFIPLNRLNDLTTLVFHKFVKIDFEELSRSMKIIININTWDSRYFLWFVILLQCIICVI